MDYNQIGCRMVNFSRSKDSGTKNTPSCAKKIFSNQNSFYMLIIQGVQEVQRGSGNSTNTHSIEKKVFNCPQKSILLINPT